MGICGRIRSFYRREEPPEDKRGKVCLANGELYTINHTPHLRVRDVCIEIAKLMDIAPVALDFFTLMTTDCEHCLRPNRQIPQQCDKQNDHYLNPKRVLHADEIASKVFFFRLAFKAVVGPDLKLINKGSYEYFVMQCRWDYINGRINFLSRKDHLTLLVLESIIRAHEEGVSSKDILENPKRFGLSHMFFDDEYSVREIKNHLKRQLSQFKTAQNNEDKAKNSFLFVLESVPDFGVTKIVVQKFYYQSATEDVYYPVEWEILISANGLKKRRTYKDERDVNSEDTTANSRVVEMISDYKDIEYLEIKHSESEEIIHISRQKGFLEVISVGKSMIKKESLITLVEGFYHLLVNQYKTLTKYEAGLELPISNAQRSRKLRIHGPIERKKVEALLKAVETENGNRCGVHMIRRSRNAYDSFVLSFIHGSEIKHFEIVTEDDKYSLKNGPQFDSMAQLLDFYKTEQRRFPTKLTKYCPIPEEGLCALYDDQIVVEAPCVPSTSRPANPEYSFEYIRNRQLEKLSHSFTSGDFGDKIFKARWLKGEGGGYQEVFCRRLEPSRAANFRERVVKCGEKMVQLVHRNLVLFHGICFFDDQNTYLAFEWMSSGTLDDYLKKEREVTVEMLVTFAAQIAEACMFLHEKNYVHGWLAAHNILIVNHEQIKLSDVSVPCLREEDMLRENPNINRSRWKARECFQGRPYSKESDVWAFGIVLWEMFMKSKPFQNMTDDMILQVFQQDRHLAPPKWCPEDVCKIMKSCWFTKPSQRPTFANIVVKLRQIMAKLTPQEKKRKLPEMVDEKFTIEPLVMNLKSSPAAPDENLTQTSSGSGGNYDKSDGTLKDSWTTDDSQLDLIPEKELPAMVWSPEEIEMKKIQGKYPRVTRNESPTDATYDRIGETDISFETDEETQLLTSQDQNVVSGESELIINEVQTAVDDPLKQPEHPAENVLTTSDVLPSSTEVVPASGVVEPTNYDRLPGNDPTDDEKTPLIAGANCSMTQTDSSFTSITTMDHMGFLASQLPCGDPSMVTKSTFVDRTSAFVNNASTDDLDLAVSDHVSSDISEAPRFLSGNLDPFAPDSQDRANVIFSELNSSAKNAEPSSEISGENKYVSNAKYVFNFNSGSTDPMAMAPSLNSPYIMASTKPGPSLSSSRRPRYTGYIPTPGGARRTSVETKSSVKNENSYLPPSSSEMVEFSKLDPFAMSSTGSESAPNSKVGLVSSQTPSTQRQPVVPAEESVQGMFSSFLDRDPMSEIASNDTTSEAASRSSFIMDKRAKQDILQSIGGDSARYVSPSSLKSAFQNAKATSPTDSTRSYTPAAEKIPEYAQKLSSTRTNPSGYIIMPTNTPSGFRPITNISQRESTYQKPPMKSHDSVTSHVRFSELDPFSAAASKESEVNGQVPQELKPRIIEGAPFEKLCLESREARSMGYGAPNMSSPPSLSTARVFTPGVFTPGIGHPGSVPSNYFSAGVTTPSANRSAPLSTPVAYTPAAGKPCLSNLAVKLSKSKEATSRVSLTNQNSAGVLQPTDLSSSQQPCLNKNVLPYGLEKSGYVAVSRPKNIDKVKSSKVNVIDEPAKQNDLESLSNRDIFCDILQSSTAVSQRSHSPRSSARMETSGGFGGVKLYTEAESDKESFQNPYQKMASLSKLRSDVGTRVEYVKTVDEVSKRGGSSNGEVPEANEQSTLSTQASTSSTQTSSNYRRSFSGSATSLQANLQSRATATLRDRSPVNEKRRVQTPEEALHSEATDISQFSQTSLEDLLSSMTCQDTSIDEDKTPQGTEGNEGTNRSSSIGNTSLEASMGHASVQGSFKENLRDDEVQPAFDMDNIEHDLSFDNRDPFEELSSSHLDLHKKSSQELRDSHESESSDVFASELAQNTSASPSRNREILVTSYSNASKRQGSSNVAQSKTRVPEQQARLPQHSSGGPPNSNNGQNPPPVGEKPKTNRKVSDIGIEYAQVLIQRTPESNSYEEPMLGAVGGSEPAPEEPDQDVAVEPVSESGNDTTVVDPFNMPDAEESIQKLGPYYPHEKSGKKVTESFEESMKSHQIPFSSLTFNDKERELGRGAFGVVRKAKLTRPGHGHQKTRPPTDVAVKCCKDDASEIYKNSFKQEAINLMKLDNKFIVRFLGVSYNEENNLLLVTELVPQGSLFRYLKDPKNHKILGNDVLLQFAIQITTGMQYLESKKLVHRDLAARNILVASESHVKISDFGLSRIYDDEYYRSHRDNAKLPIRWLAPECLEQKKFTVYSDVWSLGVTLWEMFSFGKRPYEDCNFSSASELIQFLKAGNQLSKPSACPEDVYVQVQECWHLTPARRISFFLLKALMEDILQEKYQKKPYFN